MKANNDERKQKLELAARRNRGGRLKPQFLDGLSRALAVEPQQLELVPLNESDSIRERLLKGWEDARESANRTTHKLRTDRVDAVQVYLSEILKQVPDTPMYLFWPQSKWCGAVKVNSKRLIERALHLVSLDQNELLSSDAGGSIGVVLEHFTYARDTDDEVYELTAWGF